MSRALGFFCSGLLLSALAAWGGTDPSVTIDNWMNHPEVQEVRTIYQEIRSAIQYRRYRTTARRFNIDSPLCPTYPVKSQTLTVDSANRPRLHRLEQLGSHREPFTVERYYDAKGVLRFVYVERFISSVRIYLNREGKVFWAVEQKADQVTAFDSKDGDWETIPDSADGAREAFQEQQPCPEVKR